MSISRLVKVIKLNPWIMDSVNAASSGRDVALAVDQAPAAGLAGSMSLSLVVN
jgi:hypothetical protein